VVLPHPEEERDVLLKGPFIFGQRGRLQGERCQWAAGLATYTIIKGETVQGGAGGKKTFGSKLLIYSRGVHQTFVEES